MDDGTGVTTSSYRSFLRALLPQPWLVLPLLWLLEQALQPQRVS
jgi:hypothetical protein